MPDNNYTGLWIPLVTPLRDDAVDHAALKRLVTQLSGDGISGFVACGSTGEAALLDAHEQDAVLETICAAAGTLPVMMGVSGARPGPLAKRMQELARRFPISAFLLPPPGYIRPSQQGLLQFFNAIADASPRPLVLYDIPYRSGVKIELPTLLQLAGHPNIEALKDCGGSLQGSQAMMADGRLAVLAGEDQHIFTTLALGGAGAIAASAHLHTRHFVRLLRALREERLETARTLWRALTPLIELCFAESNPAPVKALLARLGRLQPELRAPLQGATPELGERLWMAYEEARRQLEAAPRD